MRIGDTIFRLSANNEYPVPKPPIPEFDETTQPDYPRPEFEEEVTQPDYPRPEFEEITQPDYPRPEFEDTDVEIVLSPEDFETEEEVTEEKPEEAHEIQLDEIVGWDAPEDPPPENNMLVPSAFEGADLRKAVRMAIAANPERRDQILQAANVASDNPYDYLVSQGPVGYVKRREFDPITAWVLDNKVIGEDPQLTIDWLQTEIRRQNTEIRPYTYEAVRYLIEEHPLQLLPRQNIWMRTEAGRAYTPYLWEASLALAPTTEQGKVFTKEDVMGNQVIDDKLLKDFLKLSAFTGQKFEEFFEERAEKVAENMINMRYKKPGERKQKLYYLKHRKAHKKNIEMLAKIATRLDYKGEFDIANEIDGILRQAMDMDPEELLGAFMAGPGGVKEVEPGREKDFVEMMRKVEREEKGEDSVDREKDVEELSEEDLDTGYLVETMDPEKMWDLEDYGSEGQFIDKLKGE